MKILSKKITALLILSCILSSAVSMTGCGRAMQAESLMGNIESNEAEFKMPDNSFGSKMMNSYVKLFKAVQKSNKEKNIIVSPMSVTLALAMAANGAGGQTREEMEAVLGEISIEELNKYLLGYSKELSSEEKHKLHTANSIWFKNDKNLLYKLKNPAVSDRYISI